MLKFVYKLASKRSQQTPFEAVEDYSWEVENV